MKKILTNEQLECLDKAIIKESNLMNEWSTEFYLGNTTMSFSYWKLLKELNETETKK